MRNKTQKKKDVQLKQNNRNYEITGIIMLLFGVFSFVSLANYNTGILGSWANNGLHFLFGMGAFLSVLVIIFMGGYYVLTAKPFHSNRYFYYFGVLFCLCLSLIHHFFVPIGEEFGISNLLEYGGAIGSAISWALHISVGEMGTSIILVGAIVIDILLLTHWSVSNGARKVGVKAQKIGLKTEQKLEDAASYWKQKRAQINAEKSAARLEPLEESRGEFIYKKSGNETPDDEEKSADFSAKDDEPIPDDIAELLNSEESSSPVQAEQNGPDLKPIDEENMPFEATRIEPVETEKEAEEVSAGQEGQESEAAENQKPNGGLHANEHLPDKSKVISSSDQKNTDEPAAQEYVFPPLSLLHTDGPVHAKQDDIQHKAKIIESTLASFGVGAKVINASVGPTVTRFELKPEIGVRVSKIEGLSNELAMALAATHIRIEAPIPGKSAVGIEIPNSKIIPVPLRDVLASDEFQKGKGHILVALGKDITGKPVVTDLSKMPHLLIAGSTGSGKSVCINSIITSIIYKSKPSDVKLMLIDPKVVELSVYNGIPHLRTEVVTDMKKAQGTLNWAVREMESRYQLFAGCKVRNIEGYNNLNPDKKMPYILIIVDEFADLMNVAAKEVEVLIQRLTQKARAAGIHLILATQRPSADVITGVIKSNIPSRISFMVESNLNSRIILDEGGAESLLGKGDMLFKRAGALNLVRIQGAFIPDEEVENVVNYVKNECLKQESEPVKYEPIDLSIPEKSSNEANAEDMMDDLLQEASEWVLDTKRASVSALQRRFRIGYTRAGRLMDSMEKMGIVGPAEGAKPREILMTKDKVSEMFMNMENSKEEEQQ